MSTSALTIPATLIQGDKTGSDKINTDLTMAQANSITNKTYLVPSGPPATSASVIIPGQVVQGFCSESTEYALSVIGVLCIVYGIVAK
jgi:hypothetical protein